MEKFNKYSRCKTYLGAKPTTEKFSSLADHGFGLPMDKVVSEDPRFNLVVVGGQLMWESKATGQRFDYTHKDFLGIKAKFFSEMSPKKRTIKSIEFDKNS